MMMARSEALPDSPYAYWRLLLALVISTISGVGMWAIIVVLPAVQAEFGIARGQASLPYTLTMVGFAFGTIVLGRLSDRFGIVLPIAIASLASGTGFVLAGLVPGVTGFSVLHILIGIGAGAGFAPMMADISHWFVRKRGLAVVIVASGNYLAGTV